MSNKRKEQKTTGHKNKEQEETHNEMSEAFNANMEFNNAFNKKDGDEPHTEGDSLAHYYMQNNTAAVDVSARRDRKSDMEEELKKHD